MFQDWSDLHAADEVHVVARFFPRLNYNLQMTRKGKLSSSVDERAAFFLFGPEDPEGTKTVRAVLMVDKAYTERWIDQDLAPGVLSADDRQITARLNGYATTSPRLKSLADDAIRERGLTKAPEFFYMESWGPGGCDRALTPDTTTGVAVAGGVVGLGVVFLVVAIRRFLRRHKVLEKQELLARQVEYARADMIAKYKAQGLPVPDVLTAPLKPGRSKSRIVLGVFLALIVGTVVQAKFGIFDGALFAIPLVILVLIVMGMKQVGKVVSTGVTKVGEKVAEQVIPERTIQPDAPRIGPRTTLLPEAVAGSPLRVSDNNLPGRNLPRQSAITSVPSLGQRLSSALSAPALVKWAPFGIGVIIMVVGAKLFGGFSGSVGNVAKAPAATVGQAPLGALGDMSVLSMVGYTLGAVATLALLGFGLNLMVSRFAARRNIDYPNDPWARLDRMTAAERARG